MSASRVALVVVYNHKYERNIPKVEAIYRERFDEIFHLVPFAAATEGNVIAVYENSQCFQGYIAQGLRWFFRPYFTHYIFVADDLALNPAISSASYRDFFALDERSSFIPRLESLPAGPVHWPGYRNGILFDPFRTPGVEVRRELPPPEEAARLLRRHGVSSGDFTFEQVYGSLAADGLKAGARRVRRFLADTLAYRGSLRRMKYPLARSYSDLTVVSAECVRPFCHYCGVFAATDLFAELAIPTALALASERIVTEEHLALRGKELWSAEEHAQLNEYGYRLDELFRRFPRDCLYIHPVKLSAWSLAGG